MIEFTPIELVHSALNSLLIEYLVSVVFNAIAFLLLSHWILKKYDLWVNTPRQEGSLKRRWPNTVMYTRVLLIILLVLIVITWIYHMLAFIEIIDILKFLYEAVLYDLGVKSV